MSVRILEGDALTVLRTLPDQSVQCCVTSPPYWRQRDYGVAGQLGLERTPEEYRGWFDTEFPAFDPEKAAQATNLAWLAYLEENRK